LLILNNRLMRIRVVSYDASFLVVRIKLEPFFSKFFASRLKDPELGSPKCSGSGTMFALGRTKNKEKIGTTSRKIAPNFTRERKMTPIK
jgi:hypothetical protein